MRNINIIIILIVLIVAFILITSVKKPSPVEDISKQIQPVQYKVLSCLERCGDTKVCRDYCDTITINQAVLAKDIKKCNEITKDDNKVLCKDKVTFSIAVSNKDAVECNNIANIDLRNSCIDLTK